MLKKAFFAGSLVLGLGIFAFVIAKFGGVAKTIEVVAEVGWPGLTVYILNAAVVQIAPAFGWWILMRGEGMKASIWTTLKANFMGFPLNFIAPTMYLGAEPLKLLYVARTHGEPKRRILATIVVSKFQEIGAVLLVLLVAAVVSIWRMDFGRKQEVFMICSVAALIIPFGLVLYAFIGNHKPTVKIINFLAMLGIAKRRLARLRTRAEEMEALIHASFIQRWRTFLAAQAVTLISALSIFMRPWLFFFFTRERIVMPTEQLCAIYTVTNLINSLPHTPGGLGIFEGGMAALFKLMEIDSGHMSAFLVVNRAADVVFILTGLWLIAHYGLQSLAKRVVKGEEKATLDEIAGVSPIPGPDPDRTQ